MMENHHIPGQVLLWFATLSESVLHKSSQGSEASYTYKPGNQDNLHILFQYNTT